MKFTDEQKELLALLPNTLKNSQELTDSAKLVLSNIIFLYGMEDAQKNGYVYRTNSKMMEEINIKSEHTLIGAVRLLELLGYIETKRGKRNEASTYKLLKNCSNKCSNKCSNDLENCSIDIETLQNQVLLLQKQMVLLQKEIENLKNCSNKCSTDTDIDEDIDKDMDKDKTPVDNVTEVTLQENKINKNENGDMDMMENATRGKVVKSEDLTNSNDGIEQNKDNSSTGEMDIEIRNIDGLSDFSFSSSSSGDTVESKVSAVSDNGTSGKNAENKNITSTQRTGNNSSTQGNDTSKREALVAATMQKIDQLKRQMYDSRNSELNFNIFFDEFKRCMDVMKANTSTEAYANYRAQIGKWWRKTKKYLPYREEKITAAADAPNSDNKAERMNLDYAVESCIYERNSDKVQGGLMHIIKYFETHTDEELAEEIIQKLNNHRHGNAILDSVLGKIGIICF